MKDIVTKDHQLWVEYQQDTGAKEIGFFNDLEVASEFLAQVSEVPAKFGINEDCSLVKLLPSCLLLLMRESSVYKLLPN